MRLTPETMLLESVIASPILRVQVLLQCQNDLILSRHLERPYRGIIDCFKQVVKKEGFRYLWRGTNGLLFGNLCILSAAVAHNRLISKYELTVASKIGITMASYMLLHPSKFLFTRMAADVISAESGSRTFRGHIDVVKKILASDGIRGIYRGFLIGYFCRIISLNLVYNLMKTAPIMIDYINPVYAALLHVVCVEVMVHPLDTIQRRMMMRSGKTEKFTSSFHCARYIFQREGFLAFFNGLGASGLRSCILNFPFLFLSIKIWKAPLS